MTTPITEHFTYEELIHSDTAVARHIDNTPPQEARRHLVDLARGLEEVRKVLGDRAIHINVAFRSPELNRVIGGVHGSAHLLGYAADIVCPEFGTPYDICVAVAKSGIAFDQLIYEGTWVHISFDPKMRHQRLSHKGGGYVPGIVH